ncbi:MAG TPA: carboxypeptidase-like regulatory domain-containing protein [Thermoanaerobaculia bacterium]|nr:carboxypeptidase-like regulatory domain-containing protein [Thermoanaerobaculia bacterium]
MNVVLAVIIYLTADRWPAKLDEMPKAIPSGDAMWVWSDDCAPRRVSDVREIGECDGLREVDVVVDAKRAGEIEVRWGTEAMLRDIPDAMLPMARAGANGEVRLRVPEDVPVFARAAGPVLASRWTELRGARTRIEAVAAKPIAFRVIENGGKNAEHAMVEIRSVDLRQPLGLAYRGAGNGAVALPPISAAGYLSTLAWSESGAPLVVNGTPRVIELAHGFEMRGQILDEREHPIEGAAISALFFAGNRMSAVRKQTRSDARGRFAIRGLPAGNVEWHAAKEPFARVAQMVSIASDLDTGSLILRRARDVPFIVIDAHGKPIAGATIRTSVLTAIADAKGRAVLAGAPADGFNARIAARGFLPHEVSVNDEALLRVELRDAARLRAHLIRVSDGAPAGPGTAAVDLDGRKTIATFDEQGVLEIDDLEAGTLSVELRADGLSPFRLPPRAISDGEVVDLGEIRLDRGLTISGRTVDETGAPLAGVTVRVLRPSSFGPLLSYVRRDWVSTESDADGFFRVHGLAPGIHTLFTEAASRAPAVRGGIELVPDLAELAIGDLTIPLGRTLVVDCRPSARCGTEAKLIVDDADWFDTGAPMRDGHATMAPVPCGTATLRLSDARGVIHEREVSISRDHAETHIDVRLTGLDVSGRVTRAGRPLSGGRVMFSTTSQSARFVQLAYSAGTGHLGNEIIGTVPRQISAAVADDGTFALTGVNAGDYQVAWSDGVAQSAPQQVTIAANAPLHIELPSAGIAGIVRTRERGPLPRVFVAVEQGDRRVQVVAESDGSFAIVGLAPGPATIRASTGPSRAASTSVVIAENEVEHVDLVLDDARERELAVLVQSRSLPIANAFVFLREGASLRAVTTAGDGRAVFRSLRGDSVELAVYAPTAGWTFVPARSAQAEIAVELQHSSSSLVVRKREGSAALAIRTASGFPLHSALAILGMPAAAHASAPFRIDRLPAGLYSVTADGAPRSVTLAAEPSEISF